MMDALFFATLVLFLVAVVLQFMGQAFKKDMLLEAAFTISLIGTAALTGYIVWRGIVAQRIPLSNQFGFATAFAWGIALLHIFLRRRFKEVAMSTAILPAIFLVLSYAALQPRDIRDLMPALRSAWFGLHIGTAVFSYAAFVGAGSLAVLFLVREKKGQNLEKQADLDYLIYRLIAFGFLMLTVVILSGAIWAEAAWSSFWSWDPKETWALITWIVYAIYLHQRLRAGRSAHALAWFAVIAVIVVAFTFVGVNTLLPGLHSYG